MADFVIVDTDILIDAGRGVAEATSRLQAIERLFLHWFYYESSIDIRAPADYRSRVFIAYRLTCDLIGRTPSSFITNGLQSG